MMETLRSQDLPGEILADEDVTLTLPRRLGLSEVVDAQIRRYREEVRRRGRVSDDEILDLMRLVLRRPDAQVLFRRVGEELAGLPAAPGAIRRLTPAGLSFRLGRRRIRSRLKSLFGRSVVVPGPGPTQFKAAISLFQLPDGGKAAAEIVSGLAYATLSFYTGKEVEVNAVWEAESSKSGLVWEMRVM